MILFPAMSQIIDQMPAHGSRIALVESGDRSLTYTALYDAVLRRAAGLQKAGVTKGDRILLVENNDANYVIGLWAGFLVGAVVVPVSPELPFDRLAFIVENSGAVIALCHLENVQVRLAKMLRVYADDEPTDTQVNTLRADIETSRGSALTSSDLALIIYTSGSTGNPKGVTLSHLNVFSACQSVSAYLGIDCDDRVFCAVPFTFDYGMHQITMCALHGAALHIETSFARPHLSLRRIEAEGITCVPIVPAMVRMMQPLYKRYDLSQVKKVTNTAAALRPAMIDQLQLMLPQADIFSMYGLTECHRCTFLPPAELEAHSTSVGYAIPDTQMWVVDDQGQAHSRDAVGELMIRGNTVMRGYWNNPSETQKSLHVDPVSGDRHLKTGDLCSIDADGRLTFISRCDSVVKVHGEKWIPTMADSHLSRFPHCSDVACVAVEDGLGDFRTMAFVVPSPKAKINAQDLRGWCAENLESVYVPERVEIVDALPRTPNGKPDLQNLNLIASQHFS